MSLLSFHSVSLNLAGKQLLDEANLTIQPGEKIALVGRNGAGKSTLLNVLQGDITPDKGHIQKQTRIIISGLTQDVPIKDNESIYYFLVKDLKEQGEVLWQYHQLLSQDDSQALMACQAQMDELNLWDVLPKVDAMASRLGLSKDAKMNELSGGMKRRALLASALISEPDLLILDEPTNHLDIQTIEWLESHLKNYAKTLLLVTHDRTFLSAVCERILEIDRGKLNRFDCSYEKYLDRKEAMRISEQKQNENFDKKLRDEEVWIRQGIKARRTRNEGRVRALEKLREVYKNRQEKMGRVADFKVDVTRSGKLVIDAEDISYTIESKPIIQSCSLQVMSGAKIGIIGPNGSGKTTLVRLLLQELTPDIGQVKHGTSVKIAYFDQLRRALDESDTVMNNIGEGSDYVTINGKSKHVATVLKDFLFQPESFNRPVSTLSGGERNRLLIAKLLSKPVNLLVMDEPTNDLDIESLELLEQLLVDYSGTLLLISHDRTFINHVVTSVVVYEGNGQFNEYVGGYDDYQQKLIQKHEVKATPVKKIKSNRKLSYNEQREVEQLPLKIEQLEGTIAQLQGVMADPGFYQQQEDEIIKHNQKLADAEHELNQLFERWESLEERK